MGNRFNARVKKLEDVQKRKDQSILRFEIRSHKDYQEYLKIKGEIGDQEIRVIKVHPSCWI